jgi:phosphoglycolate phosphatase
VKVILFDFDGTIADTVVPAAKILQRIAGEFGLKGLTDEAMEKWRNFSIPEIVKQLHFPVWKLPFVAKRTKEEMNKQIEFIHPIVGITEVINKLRKTYTIGIVTSNNKNNVKAFLEKNNMNFFDFIFTGTSIFGKARQIKNALEKNHITQKDVVYIGDEIRDIQACKKLSIPIVAVTWGFNTKQALQHYNPDYIISKPEKLLHIL